MNQSRVQKLEKRILTLEKILQMFPSGQIATNDEKVILDMLLDAKKEYKLQMYQD
jgi:hypothetical protein|tara:strand:+ start:414 stop:578 length:165 start_codon:yes stop_codon:yes gene_type:complete